jgi:F-type H+-transporting ATPase subunit gamma
MPNLKDIRNRIGSVKKTKQITSAMKLVAGAKLKRATDRAVAARPYREQLAAVLQRVAGAAGENIEEPLLQSRDEVKRILVVVLTSDRGLCGGFNNNLLRNTGNWLAEKRRTGVEIDVRVYGRKGQGYFRRVGEPLQDSVVDYGRAEKMDLVRPLTSAMVSGFVDGDVDEVYLVFNRFVSALVQTPTYERVLPLTVEAQGDDVVGTEGTLDGVVDYRFEPGAAEILGTLLPLYLQTLVLSAFLETEAGEFAARMTAMDNATRNASDLIERLSLDYNRARQAAITTEIIEIVSGAAAL